MNIVLANYMISKGKERSWAAVNAIGLVLAIIANFVLIPRFGVVGSAISISLCEALMFVMRSYVCREFLSGIRLLRMERIPMARMRWHPVLDHLRHGPAGLP